MATAFEQLHRQFPGSGPTAPAPTRRGRDTPRFARHSWPHAHARRPRPAFRRRTTDIPALHARRRPRQRRNARRLHLDWSASLSTHEPASRRGCVRRFRFPATAPVRRRPPSARRWRHRRHHPARGRARPRPRRATATGTSFLMSLTTLTPNQREGSRAGLLGHSAVVPVVGGASGRLALLGRYLDLRRARGR